MDIAAYIAQIEKVIEEARQPVLRKKVQRRQRKSH
jgi:hypothetical protein